MQPPPPLFPLPPLSSLLPTMTPLYSLRKVQASHRHQQSMAYETAIDQAQRPVFRL